MKHPSRGGPGPALFSLFILLLTSGCSDGGNRVPTQEHKIEYTLLVSPSDGYEGPHLNWSRMDPTTHPDIIKQALANASANPNGKSATNHPREEGEGALATMHAEWERQNPQAGAAPDEVIVLYEGRFYDVDLVTSI